MAFDLPDLPYGRGDLAPHISEDTLNFHYGKHHNAYVTNLNKMIDGTDHADASLEEIITAAAGDASKAGLFNNAAQVWNHTFYWHSMKPRRRRPADRQNRRDDRPRLRLLRGFRDGV